MIQLHSLILYLDSLLEASAFKDSAINGLQVETSNSTIRKVAYAVDSGLSVIKRAVEIEADILIVHHGLFWGQEIPPIRNTLGRKMELLMKHGCSLYASHLPLDGHPEIGNGAVLARFFGLNSIQPYCEFGGRAVGARGSFKKEVELSSVVEKARELVGAIEPLVLPFGKPKITNVGVVTGSGSFAITSCAKDGLDLLISGEPKQEAFHLAKELRINAIFAGHYATETVGVSALAKRIEKDFDVTSEFINEPTGI